MSMLLRIQDDQRFVLFNSVTRPGSFGPPGGVVKYFPPANAILEELGFQAERRGDRGADRSDLRGFVPAAKLRPFLRWFDTGAYRECAAECLLRELVEELAEVDLPSLVASVRSVAHTKVRSVVEGPHPIPGRPFRQYRRFEVYDLVTSDAAALHLVSALLDAGNGEGTPLVVVATRESILHGRHGNALIAPHAALLFGDKRVLPDIPAVR